MGRMRQAARGVVVVAAALSFVALPAPGGSVPTAPTAVPGDIADRYLAHQPTLGPVTVVTVGGEGNDRKLLAATLQGVVNRTQARIYLLGMRAQAEDQYWLDWYQAQDLIDVVATVNLDTALQTFAGELNGYVMASYDEPWTINTATSVAGAEQGVVVTSATVGSVQAEAIPEIADHRGDWPDAATAYDAIADQYRDELDYQGAAIQKPDANNPRDLFVQQGILTMFTRPSQGDFDAVYDIIDTYPTEHPVYGYVSDTGEEEVAAVARLALAGRFLVPTDTTDNLSFHIAVGGTQRATVDPPSVADTEPCSPDDVNVVLAVSDGDNMVIPEGYLPRENAWSSPRRGELPIGWGISPVTSILMPAVWDHYAETATANDEIVDIMGLGYSFPSVMPTGKAFLTDGSRLRSALGVGTHWSLDALIRTPTAGGWSMWHDAIEAAGSAPEGYLLNYVQFGGPPWFHTPDGVPVLASQETEYAAGPAQIEAELTALLAEPAAERPLVNLFSVTVWSTSYGQLVDTVKPLEDQGVRFLTPREAFACLPDPPVVEPTTTTTVDPEGPVPTTSAPGSSAPGAPGAPGASPLPGTAGYVG